VPASTSVPAVLTRGLTKDYGALRALAGLDLTVGQGEIYGFLGPNGAGKTTAIRILTGASRPTSGEARVGGVDVLRDPVAAKAHVGVVSQHANVDPDLTVRQNLVVHALLHGMGREARERRIAHLLDFAELSDRAGSLARTLSGGMKRRLTIVRALLHEPRILFLDEPTTGLDPMSRRRMWDLVRAVHADGVSVFLTTHYIEEAETLCARVGILHKGRLIAEGAPRALMAELGDYAVDYVAQGTTSTRNFAGREDAIAFLGAAGGEGRVRPTNLEDLFLQRTGQRVTP
jgi:ABC-2 type transport system ATP-binding protein